MFSDLKIVAETVLD